MFRRYTDMKPLQRIVLSIWLPLGALFFLAGCSTMAPLFSRPAAPVPAAWPTGAAYKTALAGSGDQIAAGIAWREFFVDPQLQKVIELALANNRDLRVAALTIERTRAQYQIQRAGLFPQVNAAAAGSMQRVPPDLSPSGKAVTSRQFS